MFKLLYLLGSVSSSLRAGNINCPFGVALSFPLSELYLHGSFRGAFLFFRPRAFIFSLFARGRRKCASRKAPKQKNTNAIFQIGQSGGIWPILALGFIFLCLWEQERGSIFFKTKTLRYCTGAKYTNCIADDTPQDTTATQNKLKVELFKKVINCYNHHYVALLS